MSYLKDKEKDKTRPLLREALDEGARG